MTGVGDACCTGAGVDVGASVGVGVNVGTESEALERTGVAVGFVCGVDVATADVEELQAIAASANRPNAVHMTRSFRNCPVLCYHALPRRALTDARSGIRFRPIKLRCPQW
ncbi:MAG: hypothetical protein IH868_02045 [Chloroflexi bacterium]|nr:hypothetical protein [Chloroflexota bacterium]